jgi:hypothetical protein
MWNTGVYETDWYCFKIGRKSIAEKSSFLSFSDDHQSSTRKTLVSSATHEFRTTEPPGDDYCLYAAAIHLFDRSETINVKSLRTKITNYIRESKDIDDISLINNTGCQTREEYCRKVEQGAIWFGASERHALAQFYPSSLFCIISRGAAITNEPAVHIDIYVKDISSYKKCIIIFYDDSDKYYILLFLYDKINEQEEYIRLKYDDVTKSLLAKFIKNTLKCKNFRWLIKYNNNFCLQIMAVSILTPMPVLTLPICVVIWNVNWFLHNNYLFVRLSFG